MIIALFRHGPYDITWSEWLTIILPIVVGLLIIAGVLYWFVSRPPK